MKRMIWMAIAAIVLLGVSSAAAQSLGDVARSARKTKAHQSAVNHQYDNDNLPKDDHISVVGPAASDANTVAQSGEVTPSSNAAASASQNPAPDPKQAAADRQRAADELKDKIDAQKKNIESLNHELELTQREYRLRAVAMYSDAGNRLRNSATWDKEDADFKKQLDEKQKAVDAAKQELDNLQEQARKSGVRERE